MSLVPILQGDLIITLHFRKMIDAMTKIIELEPINNSEDETNLNKPEEHPLQVFINNKTPIQSPLIVKTNVIKSSTSENVNQTSITENNIKPIVENIPIKVKNIPENPVFQNRSSVEQIKVNGRKPDSVENIPENPILENKSNVEQIKVNGKKPESIVKKNNVNIDDPNAKTLSPNGMKIEQDKVDDKEDETDEDEGHAFTNRWAERKTNELKILIKGYMYEEIYN